MLRATVNGKKIVLKALLILSSLSSALLLTPAGFSEQPVEQSFEGVWAQNVREYERAIEHEKATGDKEALAQAYKNLGSFYLNDDKPAAALPMFKNAFAVRLSQPLTSDKRALLDSYVDVALCYIRLKQYDQAESIFQKAVVLAKTKPAASDALLGELYAAQIGLYGQHANMVLLTRKQFDDFTQKVASVTVEGLPYLQAYLQQVGEGPGRLFVLNSYLLRSDLTCFSLFYSALDLMEQHKYEAAKEQLKLALRDARKDEYKALIHYALGAASSGLQDFDNAQEELGRAKLILHLSSQISDDVKARFVAKIKLAQGVVQHLPPETSPEEQIRYYEELLATQHANNNQKGMAYSYWFMALAYEQRDDLKQAEVFSVKSVELAEKLLESENVRLLAHSYANLYRIRVKRFENEQPELNQNTLLREVQAAYKKAVLYAKQADNIEQLEGLKQHYIDHRIDERLKSTPN